MNHIWIFLAQTDEVLQLLHPARGKFKPFAPFLCTCVYGVIAHNYGESVYCRACLLIVCWRAKRATHGGVQRKIRIAAQGRVQFAHYII